LLDLIKLLRIFSPNGGGKCFSLTKGKPVGNPQCEHVRSYGWVYVWPIAEQQ